MMPVRILLYLRLAPPLANDGSKNYEMLVCDTFAKRDTRVLWALLVRTVLEPELVSVCPLPFRSLSSVACN